MGAGREAWWLGVGSFLFIALQSLCTAVMATSGVRVVIGLGALAAAGGGARPGDGVAWRRDPCADDGGGGGGFVGEPVCDLEDSVAAGAACCAVAGAAGGAGAAAGGEFPDRAGGGKSPDGRAGVGAHRVVHPGV